MKIIFCDKNGNPSKIKEIVNDKTWQALRESFLGTWTKTPVENVTRLRKYLGDKPWTDPLKLRRVHNYLTGTGFRTKTISHATITTLLEEVVEAEQLLK